MKIRVSNGTQYRDLTLPMQDLPAERDPGAWKLWTGAGAG